MPNPSSSSFTFYPAYCLSLSPTYNTWARLTAADVHALQERDGYDGQNIYFHLNHPIKWIRLVGVVVALDFIPNRWLIQLDDYCGATIELTCLHQTAVASKTDGKTDLSDKAHLTSRETNIKSDNRREDRKQIGVTATGRTVDLTGVDVGAVVKVKGGVGVFRGEKQVLLERISLLHSTNDEVASWAETSAFRRDVLNVPWVVNEQDLKRAARKAEGRGRRSKVRPEQKTKKHQKPESKQKYEHDKDRGHNRDKGKEPDKIAGAARQKLERRTTISARDVRIPPDQQRRLDRQDSWLPDQPAARERKQKPGSNPVTSLKDRPGSMQAGRYDALGL